MASMEECIRETPLYLINMLKNHEKLFLEIAGRTFTKVIISGSGSSYHAGMAARGVMQKYMNLPVEVLYPFQVEDYIFTDAGDALFIGVSQSGTSLSTYRAMLHAKEAGCIIASMSGRDDEGVILNEIADYILTVSCGDEGDLQPKTKGMICTIVNLILLGLNWSYTHGVITKKIFCEALDEIEKTAEQMPVIINAAENWIEKNGEIFVQTKDVRVVGTKDIYGIVLEGSLKLVETLRVPVSGYDFEEFIHGIYNAISEDSVVVLLDTGIEERIKTMKDILSQWSTHIIISGKNAVEEQDFYVPSAGYPDYAVLEYILWIFMICEKVSAMKGIDIRTTKDTCFHAKLGSKKLR
ncbi:MAG: phosphosugar isomerase [Herbinix sp.]|nr:phosphosugar isomerase [Herbinix sp.]